MSESTSDIVSLQAERIAALEKENETLSLQIRQLIKAEGKLYEFQQQLDTQLKEYSGLYELNKALNAVADIPDAIASGELNNALHEISDQQNIFSHAITYATNNLGYERVVFLQQLKDSDCFTVCASGGYFEIQEKQSLMTLSIPQKAPLLSALKDGPGYLVCSDMNCQSVLADYRTALQMGEYLLYSLGSRTQPMCLLVVGNSDENARFYKRVNDSEATLLGIGNFAELLSSSLENKIYYVQMKKALQLESLAKTKYRDIFENSVEGIFQSSPEGRFISCNPAIASILGYDTPEDLIESISNIGQQLYVHPHHRDELIAMMLNGRDVINFEVEFHRKDGSTILILLSLRGIFNSEGNLLHIDGIVRDITAQRKLEEQLRQSQKMEVVGTLSGGLAHDFNNVLGGIMGMSSLLRLQLEKGREFTGEQLCAKLDAVIELCRRAADIVAQLMVISRKKEASLVPVDLRTVIKNVVHICQNTFDKAIELSVNVPDNQILINADVGQIEQVLLNLCVNASHAMTIMRNDGEIQGGELYITAERRFTDRHFCAYHPAAMEGEEYWVLSVRDTGIGMNTTTISRIFDPFFTTKEKGKGTGLGLSMVYTIVQQHNGFINVYSEPGAGTTFNVYLPVLAADTTPGAVCDIGEIPTGEGLILVADDEPFIRQAAQSILEECGYTVLLAENGETAVSLYRERATDITAIIMDMVMPKKSGLEAFLEIREINPDVKILFASGFMQDDRIEKLSKMGVTDFINKPYSMRMLAEAIAKVLK